MDILGEVKRAMEQRVVEMTPPEGLSASLATFDPVAQAIQSAATDRTKS